METTKCAYCDPATSAEAWVNIDEDYGGPYKARIMTHYRWNPEIGDSEINISAHLIEV